MGAGHLKSMEHHGFRAAEALCIVASYIASSAAGGHLPAKKALVLCHWQRGGPRAGGCHAVSIPLQRAKAQESENANTLFACESWTAVFGSLTQDCSRKECRGQLFC